MGHCEMCRLLPHCPLPAQREELAYDFRDCAFYERLSPLEWSLKLGREWAEAQEAHEYYLTQQSWERHEKRKEAQGAKG